MTGRGGGGLDFRFLSDTVLTTGLDSNRFLLEVNHSANHNSADFEAKTDFLLMTMIEGQLSRSTTNNFFYQKSFF